MADLLYFLRLTRARAGWMLLGAVLSVLVVGLGLALLGLAGAVAVGAVAAGAWLLRPVALARSAARYLEKLTTHEATFRILADIRLWFFDRLAPLVPGRIGGLRAGDLLSRLVGDVDALDGLYIQLVTPSIVALLAALALAAILSAVAPAVAVAVLLILLLAGIGVPALTERVGRAAGREQLWRAAELHQQAIDVSQGLTDLIAHGAVERALSEVAQASARHGAVVRHQAVIAAAGAAATQMLTQSALVAVLLVGVVAADAAGEGVGPLLAIAAFVTLAAFEAVAPLPLAYQMLGRTRSASQRLREIAELLPAVTDPVRPAAVPDGTDIRIEGVRFAYPGADRPAVVDIDLEIATGERLAIVGPSGSGKSTLFGLLMRFHDPDAGTVRLGGTDLRDLAQAELHARLGVLSQGTPILAGTLRDNLLLGSPDADAAALARALRIGGLERMVDELPQGLDTWLGEAGVAVSGGEGRRVALARVVLRDAPILLLDEPTEGLDAETERSVLAALEEAMAGKTVVMITHRPAVARAMQRVVRIEGGRLVS
ncbi:thiol reductant ABC exporter subunit CydC [Thalassobaculum sp. OXR-137]|uniref:thiol reductant ABC exporter subunit CydC n=1 Tax=Thalassobaculum sp. OXR-137 TaxID=3100173 RepID=UPI002AC9064A|nr:thiol reductant ABC exporter subunit CydC [Thalassobaculum sp. OXR-137]WPZ36631.1 thiol reductant ABC exporter subunit CydC [Thalassobaculum sp. OXR-137]